MRKREPGLCGIVDALLLGDGYLNGCGSGTL